MQPTSSENQRGSFCHYGAFNVSWWGNSLLWRGCAGPLPFQISLLLRMDRVSNVWRSYLQQIQDLYSILYYCSSWSCFCSYATTSDRRFQKSTVERSRVLVHFEESVPPGVFLRDGQWSDVRGHTQRVPASCGGWTPQWIDQGSRRNSENTLYCPAIVSLANNDPRL
jgi:hypothetical protein